MNKKHKTGHQFDERQSFDRFDDQLIQTVGYYMPLKDKISLIGVNRRFNKCLLESQRDLVIDYTIGNRFKQFI